MLSFFSLQFSKEVYKQCPELPFKGGEDTAFVLSFSLIMLNTDLHSARIADDRRMTFPEFLTNNRDIDAGSPLPEPFMKHLYESLKDREIELRAADSVVGPAVSSSSSSSGGSSSSSSGASSGSSSSNGGSSGGSSSGGSNSGGSSSSSSSFMAALEAGTLQWGALVAARVGAVGAASFTPSRLHHGVGKQVKINWSSLLPNHNHQ